MENTKTKQINKDKHLKHLISLAKKHEDKLDYTVEEVNPFPEVAK